MDDKKNNSFVTKRIFPQTYKRIKLIRIINGYMGYNNIYLIKSILKNIHNFSKWKLDAERIAQSYKYIKIYTVWKGRIGETLCSYFMHLSVLNDKDTLKIMSSMEYAYENKSLLKIMNRYIPFIIDDTYVYWIYILWKNIAMLDDNIAEYVARHYYNKDITLNPEWTKQHLQLSDDEIVYAEDKMNNLKIKEPYICIHNRDRAYLRESDTKHGHHRYRNFPIDVYRLVASEFQNKNIQLVRTGQKAERRADFPNCIDFTNDGYDELLDIYLYQKCKFAIMGESGINLLPRAYNVPTVVIHALQFSTPGYGCVPFPEKHIIIPPKYYNKNENRFLNLEEIVELDFQLMKAYPGTWIGQKYDELGIKIICNTAEEVLDVAEEMNQRIDGTWVDLEEDVELQNRFWECLISAQDKRGYPSCETVKGRIGTKYLRENKYLLDCF